MANLFQLTLPIVTTVSTVTTITSAISVSTVNTVTLVATYTTVTFSLKSPLPLLTLQRCGMSFDRRASLNFQLIVVENSIFLILLI